MRARVCVCVHARIYQCVNISESVFHVSMCVYHCMFSFIQNKRESQEAELKIVVFHQPVRGGYLLYLCECTCYSTGVRVCVCACVKQSLILLATED